MRETLLVICAEAVVFMFLTKICRRGFSPNESIRELQEYAIYLIALPIILKWLIMSFRNCRSISYFFNHPVKVLSSPKWSMQVFTNGRIIALFCIFLVAFICEDVLEKNDSSFCKNTDGAFFTCKIAIIALFLSFIPYGVGNILILVSIFNCKYFGVCDTVLLCFLTPIFIIPWLLDVIPKQPYVTKKGMDMRAIINGKKYDTETAEKIHQERIGIGFFGSTTVYRKKNGEFFLYHKPSFFNLLSDKECITPMDAVELKKYAEAHFTADDYEKVFGQVEE